MQQQAQKKRTHSSLLHAQYTALQASLQEGLTVDFLPRKRGPLVPTTPQEKDAAHPCVCRIPHGKEHIWSNRNSHKASLLQRSCARTVSPKVPLTQGAFSSLSLGTHEVLQCGPQRSLAVCEERANLGIINCLSDTYLCCVLFADAAWVAATQNHSCCCGTMAAEGLSKTVP